MAIDFFRAEFYGQSPEPITIHVDEGSARCGLLRLPRASAEHQGAGLNGGRRGVEDPPGVLVCPCCHLVGFDRHGPTPSFFRESDARFRAICSVVAVQSQPPRVKWASIP
jgi:hypothetical protein